MRQRRFNNRQRFILALVAAGKCTQCGVVLGNDFHADHVIPFSCGGKTITMNGQALCPACNLKKGAKQ